MRHRKSGRKFGRTSAHREAMLRNLVCSLFEHGRIETTVAKAKEARSLAERCITYAKKGRLAFAEVEDDIPPLRVEVDKLRAKLEQESDDKKKFALRRQVDRAGKKIARLRARGDHFRRLALRSLHSKQTVKRLFDDIAPLYSERQGGYTRIYKAGFRKGDNAPIALFELVTD